MVPQRSTARIATTWSIDPLERDADPPPGAHRRRGGGGRRALARRRPALPGERLAPSPSDGASLSYGGLAAASRALAARLHHAGVRPGQRAGIALERSIDHVVAILAVLRCAATAAPLSTFPTRPSAWPACSRTSAARS